MIYSAQPVDDGPVKIGFTDNLDVHRKQLEAHYGKPLAVLATMPGDMEREAEVHAMFAHLRLETDKGKGRPIEQFRPAAELMAFIGRPLLVGANPDAVQAMEVGRPTIINLKGSDEQAAWLESIHRKTHLSKSVIVRLALELWSKTNSHPSFPSSEDAE